MAIAPVNLQISIPPTVLVGGLFPKRNVTIIASKAGVGKSLLSMWICCQCSNGGEWFFNQYNYTSSEGKNVVYFAGEAGADLFVSRLQNCFEPRDISKIFAFSSMELLKGGLDPYLNVEENAELMFQIVSHYNPEIVIFDSLMGFLSCNESDAAETNKVMSTLKLWAEKLDCAIICSHHLRKTDKRSNMTIDQDEIIGSSVITRAAGCAYVLTGRSEVKRLACVKSWWKTEQPLEYRLSTAINGKLAFLPSLGNVEDNGTTVRQRCENQILRNVGGVIKVKEFCEENKISKSTFYAAMKAISAVKTSENEYMIVGRK